MMKRQYFIPLITLVALAGCQPVELADQLDTKSLSLQLTGYELDKPYLTITRMNESVSVWEGPWNGSNIQDFKGPSGEYLAKLVGTSTDSGETLTLETVFKYTSDAETALRVNTFADLAAGTASCGTEGSAISIGSKFETNLSFNPLTYQSQPSDDPLLGAMEEAYARTASELGISKRRLSSRIITDLARDCVFDDYTLDPETSAKISVSNAYDGLKGSDILQLMAKHLEDIQLESGTVNYAMIDALLNASEGIFATNGQTVYDQQLPEITLLTDTTPSFFGEVQFSLQATDNVGIETLTASVGGQSFQYTLDKTNGSLSIHGDVGALGDGANTLIVTAVDHSGNTAVELFPITVDNSGPSIALASDEYVNTGSPTLDLTVTPPTGQVTSVLVNGVEFTQGTGDQWSGMLSLPEGQNTVSVTADMDFGLQKSVSLTQYVDLTDPILSLSGSSTAIALQDGTSLGSQNLVDAMQAGNYIDYVNEDILLLGRDRTDETLSSSPVPYLVVTPSEVFQGPAQTEADELRIDYQVVYPSGTTDWALLGTGESIMTMTVEDLGVQLSDLLPSDSATVRLKVTDVAGNDSITEFPFRLYNDPAAITLSDLYASGTAKLNLWRNGSTYPVSTCTFNTGECQLQAAESDELYSIDLSSVSTQTFAGDDLNVDAVSKIQLLPVGTSDITIQLDPFAFMNTSLAEHLNSNGESLNTAFSVAKGNLAQWFPGLDETPLSGLNGVTSYSTQAEGTILRSAIGRAAGRLNTERGSSCNSFNLAYKSAQDLVDDGTFNGSVDRLLDGCDQIAPDLATQYIAAAARDIMTENGLVSADAQFDDVARRFWTPESPTVQPGLNVGTYSGDLVLSPVVKSETENYTVRIEVNDLYLTTLSPSQTYTIDTTQMVDGVYILDYLVEDGYANTGTSKLYITVDNN